MSKLTKTDKAVVGVGVTFFAVVYAALAAASIAVPVVIIVLVLRAMGVL